jgi:hypothetical protein
MSKKYVSFSVPPHATEVGAAPVEFSVANDGKAMGRLRVSKGAVTWVSKDKTYGSKVTWEKLAELIDEHGKPEKA